MNIPRLSAANMIPSLYFRPNTDVPVTIGCLYDQLYLYSMTSLPDALNPLP
jgi:hypothetical protein